MIINIIVTILSALGIYGFYADFPSLLFIGAIAVIIEILIGIFTGQCRSIFTFVISCLIGFICTHNILIGGAIGLCFDSVIMSLLGWLMLLVSAKKLK